MDARQLVSEIEHLSRPNEVQPIPMPALALTDADYEGADKELESVRQLMLKTSGETSGQQISVLLAIVQKRELQLKDKLHELAVTKADLYNSNDIIKQWRAHSGFTSDDEGAIHFAPSAVAV